MSEAAYIIFKDCWLRWFIFFVGFLTHMSGFILKSLSNKGALITWSGPSGVLRCFLIHSTRGQTGKCLGEDLEQTTEEWKKSVQTESDIRSGILTNKIKFQYFTQFFNYLKVGGGYIRNYQSSNSKAAFTGITNIIPNHKNLINYVYISEGIFVLSRNFMLNLIF